MSDNGKPSREPVKHLMPLSTVAAAEENISTEDSSLPGYNATSLACSPDILNYSGAFLDCSARKMKALQSFEPSGTTRPATRLHIPDTMSSATPL
jgi:hypothetical protein